MELGKLTDIMTALDFLTMMSQKEWLILCFIMLAISVVVGIEFFMMTAVSAFVVATGVFGTSWESQWIGFALTEVALGVAWSKHEKTKQKDSDTGLHDLNKRVVGMEAKVTTEFVAGAGRVDADGKNWAATCNVCESLPVGSRLRVIHSENNTLHVVPLS